MQMKFSLGSANIFPCNRLIPFELGCEAQTDTMLSLVLSVFSGIKGDIHLIIAVT